MAARRGAAGGARSRSKIKAGEKKPSRAKKAPIEVKVRALKREPVKARPARRAAGQIDAGREAHDPNARIASPWQDIADLLGGGETLGSKIESELEAHEMLNRGLPRAALSNLVGKLHIIGVDEASRRSG